MFGAYAQKVPLGNGNYTVDHTATVFLMDTEGRFTGTLDMHNPGETKLEKLQQLTR